VDPGTYGEGLYGAGFYGGAGQTAQVDLVASYNIVSRATALLNGSYNIATIAPPPVSEAAVVEKIVLPTDLDSFAQRLYNYISPILVGTGAGEESTGIETTTYLQFDSDDFNRGNEDPLIGYGNWPGIVFGGDSLPKLVDGSVIAQTYTQWSSAYWAKRYPSNQQVTGTCKGATGLGLDTSFCLAVRFTNPGGGNPGIEWPGYYVFIADNYATIGRGKVGGDYISTMFEFYPYTGLVDGDIVTLRIVDDFISCLVNDEVIVSGTDSTWLGSGYGGFEVRGLAIDNFIIEAI